MRKNKQFILAALVVAVSFLSGCIVIDLNGCAKKSVKGSGNVISETRQVADFDRIHLKGVGKAFLTRGEKVSIEIKTDDNIIPLIETSVSGGKLIISDKNYNLKPTTLHYFITVNDLKGISVSGSANLSCDSTLSSDTFIAEISGSGDMSLDLEVDNLESAISGSGSMRFAGKADLLSASITGSGELGAMDLEAKEVLLAITGSGDADVHATESLSAKITGSGDVRYKGNPQIHQKITGSGKIQRRN
jgi:hypothetical protein